MTPTVESYAEPPVNRAEIRRYAGAKSEISEVESLIDSCLDELSGKLRYSVCHRLFEIRIDGETCDFGDFTVTSHSLARNLDGCTHAVVFAATIGLGLDRLIMRYTRLSPSRAHMFQAIGAERIEALCDEFSRRVAEKYGSTRPRYSPGYGDTPLESQRDIFAALDCERKIGLTLGQTMLMTPTKSVTAIIGVMIER